MNSPQGPLSWQLGAPLWAGGHKNLQKNSPQPLTRPSCQLKSWGGLTPWVLPLEWEFHENSALALWKLACLVPEISMISAMKWKLGQIRHLIWADSSRPYAKFWHMLSYESWFTRYIQLIPRKFCLLAEDIWKNVTPPRFRGGLGFSSTQC